MAPLATALETTTQTAGLNIANFAEGGISYPACPATYVRTGGYCYGAGGLTNTFLLESGASGCVYRNGSGSTRTFYAVSQCARIPGR